LTVVVDDFLDSLPVAVSMKMDGQRLNTSASDVDDDRHDPGSVRAFLILSE